MFACQKQCCSSKGLCSEAADVCHLGNNEGANEVDLQVPSELCDWLVCQRTLEGHARIVDQPRQCAPSQHTSHLHGMDVLQDVY